jgi:mono/diheme cytochrome c family protein
MAAAADAVAGDAAEIPLSTNGLTWLKASNPGPGFTQVMLYSQKLMGLVLGGLLGATSASVSAATPDRGETLVRRHCGGCHAVSSTGDSRVPAAPRFRELHKRYDPEVLAEALAEGILTGHPLMPEFRFEPDDVQAIIIYLKSLQTKQAG